ncbi:P-loop containing nucleoside triphosphate hydrolase [Pseudocohnilembus persalinus]|uniref:p-loop containing nucleoside triphosphate hydrolase n=1 Tax=Pseudocohnilembus persalinus TaxID=266149 RepID=A0A0V0QQB8_PSEPJ|nr:P-loop containing nucleoside triphosphate hydrolase [Pseudocohnilembus persalinus]|eukprot:KRX04479.1 P-loop containing nucleoside triphosphate hydrolase [Pseudocohnilembus persalinus]
MKNVIINKQFSYFLRVNKCIYIFIKYNYKFIFHLFIFFKDNQELQNYYKSNYLAFSKQQYNVINERTENKDDLIKISTLSEKVTLLTKEYGRGTDFLCTSKQVQEAGGIVVIQAFFSDDPSEETQIKGRTARQGEKGSYYIILDQNKLYGQFDIDQDTVNNMVRIGDGYEKLCEFRQIRLKSQIDNLQKNIQPCKKLHELTNIYLQSIEQNDIDSAMKYLKELNEDIVIKKQTQVQISPEQHIIFLLDNSGSMQYKPWQDLMQAFKQCIQVKAESNPNHIVSVVYYDNNAYRICTQQKIQNVINKVNEINDKELHWGGTNFNAAFEECYRILDNENYSYHNYDKTIMFMTDGCAWDNYDQTLQKLIEKFGKNIKRFQCQGFGQSVQTTTLQKIADTFQQGVGIFSQAIEAEELVQQMIQFADVEAGYLG